MHRGVGEVCGNFLFCVRRSSFRFRPAQQPSQTQSVKPLPLFSSHKIGGSAHGLGLRELKRQRFYEWQQRECSETQERVMEHQTCFWFPWTFQTRNAGPPSRDHCQCEKINGNYVINTRCHRNPYTLNFTDNGVAAESTQGARTKVQPSCPRESLPRCAFPHPPALR